MLPEKLDTFALLQNNHRKYLEMEGHFLQTYSAALKISPHCNVGWKAEECLLKYLLFGSARIYTQNNDMRQIKLSVFSKSRSDFSGEAGMPALNLNSIH